MESNELNIYMYWWWKMCRKSNKEQSAELSDEDPFADLDWHG